MRTLVQTSYWLFKSRQTSHTGPLNQNQTSDNNSVSDSLAGESFGLQPRHMWTGLIVDERLGAVQGQRGHGRVAVGGPEGRGAERRALSDGRPAVAQHRGAVKRQRSVAVHVVLVVTVRVRRGDAYSVAVHGRRGTEDGGRHSRRSRL